MTNDVVEYEETSSLTIDGQPAERGSLLPLTGGEVAVTLRLARVAARCVLATRRLPLVALPIRYPNEQET